MTNFEKLSLLMICEIYEKLEINTNIDHKVVREAILSGNTWMLEFTHDALGKQVSKKTYKEVIKTLAAYRFIRASIQNLDIKDKEELQDKYSSRFNNGSLQFPGYNGDNELDHMNVAHMLRFSGNYKEFQGIDRNSYSENAIKYRELVLKIDILKSKGINLLKLSKIKIKELLDVCPEFS